ncbi:DUF3238 domain-containing protein [Paenibacillus sp. NRS-1760]|uniref:DUF3238 domain-containing protein n=1 Tax=Paenibacillus sp. NRS-1760 TaxID=3233902 RepID=UPI003D2A9F33
MANIVKNRGSVFAPYAWLEPIKDPSTGRWGADDVSFGDAHIEGLHDGFPCYDFYKQTDFGPFEFIYTYDFRKTGDTPAALAGIANSKY